MSYTITFGTSITTTRDTLTVSDTTTFGGSNPARNTVLVFMSGNKMKFDNSISQALTLTLNSTDPLLTTAWSFLYQDTVDGWYQFLYVIIKDAYAGGTTYARYDAVYDSSTKLVYRSLIDSNIGNALSDATKWEPIASPSTLASNKGESNESLNIESTVYQRVFTFNSQYGYGNFVSVASEGCCGDCDDPESNAVYDLLSLLLNGAIEADIRTELPQGEIICRRIEATLSTC
jgi:hypothetical protein